MERIELSYFIPESDLFMQMSICLKKTKLVDHSVMENLEHFKHDYEAHDDGGTVTIIGLENHKPLSSHPKASRNNLIVE